MRIGRLSKQIESTASSATVAEFAEMSRGRAKPVSIRCLSAKITFLCDLLNIPGENEVFQAVLLFRNFAVSRSVEQLR